MVKKLIFSLLVLVFLVQVISAIDTEITVKTLPDHEVQVAVSNPDSSAFELFERFIGTSDEYGDVSFIFSSEEPNFNLILFIKKNNRTVISKKYSDNFIAGELIYIELAPSNFEFIKAPGNESSENLENQTTNETLEENETETRAKITGSAIFGEEGVFSNKTTYYISGAIILFVVGAFVFFKSKKKLKIPNEIKVKKLSELQDEKKEKFQDKEQIIEDAERKIKEAQEDIRKIRNEDKIKEARNKLAEDERELTRLREGRE